MNARKIEKLLEDKYGDEGSSDHSLRTKSWKRATDHVVPKTLSPHEWLDYYKEHGIPESHLRPHAADAGKEQPRGWLDTLKKWFLRG